MAHELAHVKNRDTLVMTMTATIAGAISMLANFGMFFGGSRDRNNPLGAIGVILMVILAPLAAMLVQMAISRTREYGADRGGAEISGQPLALASALGQDFRRGAPHREPDGRGQSGHGAHVHHQSAVRPAHGRSVLDPSRSPQPHRGADSASRRKWVRRTSVAADPAPGAPRRLNAPAPGDDCCISCRSGLRRSERLRQSFSASASTGRSPSRRPSRAIRAAAGLAAARPRLARQHSADRPSATGRNRSRAEGAPRQATAAQVRARLGISSTLGVAQLLFLDMPAHAVIDLSVRAAKADRNALHFAGLVNAVLRKVAAGGSGPARGPRCAPSQHAGLAVGEMDEDLWRRRQRGRSPLPTAERPALDLSFKDDAESAARWNWAACCFRMGSCGCLPIIRPVPELHGFREGRWWVQDAAATIPVHLLGDVRGKSVLDLCAAPGGKTLQMAALGAGVTAVDISEARLGRLRENLARTGLTGRHAWWQDMLSAELSGAVGCRAARCALLGHRHDQAPSGTSPSPAGKPDRRTDAPAAAACCEKRRHW